MINGLTCSGDESVDVEESRVVEETLGANADTENGLCQFITIPIADSLDQNHFSNDETESVPNTLAAVVRSMS